MQDLHAKRFLWNTGDTSRSIIVNSSGQYYVMAYGTAGSNCVVFDTVTVNVIPMPLPVNLGKDTCIVTDNPQLYSRCRKKFPDFKYLWSDGENTQKINRYSVRRYIR